MVSTECRARAPRSSRSWRFARAAGVVLWLTVVATPPGCARGQAPGPNNRPLSHEEVAVLMRRDEELWDALGREQASPNAERVIALAREVLTVDGKLDDAMTDPKGRRDIAMKRAAAYFILGRAEVAAGRGDDALGHLEEANRRLLALFPEGHPLRAACLNEIGVLYMKRGDYPKGVATLSEAVRIYAKLLESTRDVEDYVAAGTIMNNLGALVLRKVETALTAATIMNNLGALALRKGEAITAVRWMETARTTFDKALPLIGPNTDPNLVRAVKRNRAVTIDNLGYLKLLLGNTESGKADINSAAVLFAELYPKAAFPRGHPDVAGNLNKQGLVAMVERQFDAAHDRMSEALAMHMAPLPGDSLAPAAYERNLALLAAWRGDFRRAEDQVRDVIALQEKTFPREQVPEGNADLAISYHFLGEMQRVNGKAGPARENLKRALNMNLELARTFGLAFSEREGIVYGEKTLHDPLDSLLSIDPETAVEGAQDYAEVWRTKAIVTRILQERDRVLRQLHGGGDPALVTEYLEARQQRAYLKVATAGNPSDPRRARIEELTARLKMLEAKLLPGVTPPEASQSPGQMAPEDLVKRLPAGAVFVDLLAYTRLDSRPRSGVESRDDRYYTAFVVARGRPIVRVELGLARTIDTELADWRTSLIDRKEGKPPKENLQRLWKLLEARFPPHTTTVIVAPDGALNYLPWAALPGRENTQWAVETYTFARVPHGPALLEWLNPKPTPLPRPGPRHLVFVGGVQYGNRAVASTAGTPVAQDAVIPKKEELSSLPDPSPFVTDLGKVGERKGMVLDTVLKENATVATVCNRLPIAYWACVDAHGYLIPPAEPKPLQTGPFALEQLLLVLPSDNPLLGNSLILEDGPLTADQITRLDLSYLNLIVLGACDSNLGLIQSREGVIGLQRALHQAGARNVMASLWEVVPSLSRRQIADFYGLLVNGMVSKPEALRLAQLKMIRSKQGDASNPYFWAAWVVSGDPLPIRTENLLH
jgi:tetratricopeptide (TPR) repeat protein